MKKLLSTFRSGFQGFVERSHQREYLEALMAGAALVSMADRDFENGKRRVIELLSDFDGGHDELVTLVRACMAIGQADNDFSPRERSIVELICSTVGVDPQELGVYDI